MNQSNIFCFVLFCFVLVGCPFALLPFCPLIQQLLCTIHTADGSQIYYVQYTTFNFVSTINIIIIARRMSWSCKILSVLSDFLKRFVSRLKNTYYNIMYILTYVCTYVGMYERTNERTNERIRRVYVQYSTIRTTVLPTVITYLYVQYSTVQYSTVLYKDQDLQEVSL